MAHPGPLVVRFSERLRPPAAPVPDISRLMLNVPLPAEPTEAEVLLRFEALLRSAAKVDVRPTGAAIEPGDEVLVDVLTYANGALLPFGSAAGLVVSADASNSIPSLGVKLVGLKVGTSAQIRGIFPIDYGISSLAGREAVFLVDLKQAAQVTMPELKTPAQFAALQAGSTLEEVMATIATQLRLEKAQDYHARCRLAAASELVRRTPFEVPAVFLEHELGRRWLEREGRLLARKQLSEAEQVASFAGWQRDAKLVAEVERDAKAALLVGALLDAKKLTLTPEDLLADTLVYALDSGATTEKEAAALLKKEDPATSPVVAAIALNAALQKLVNGATVLPLRS